MGYNKLAIDGGNPVRTKPWPFRQAFGEEEEIAVQKVVRYYRDSFMDPPYNGIFEKKLCNDFNNFMGGGYTKAVSTGTAACYVALASLNLPKGSDVLLSPVTDSGPLNAIILLGLNPILMDSATNSYNIDYDTFSEKVTSKTSAVFIVHSAGEPVAIGPIIKEAHSKKIKVIEDCSQAPGARWCGRHKKCSQSCVDKDYVGNFGDIAAFSTMYRKSIAGGGSGGLVFTKNIDIYHQSLAYADRGKPTWLAGSNSRNPGDALFPALNFNTNEFTSAITSASLSRLNDTITKRCLFLEDLCNRILKKCKICKPSIFHDGFSPFYFSLFVDPRKISCTKVQFFSAIAAEGISLSPHYECLISRWEFSKKIIGNQPTPNAENFSDISANLFINERCSNEEIDDVITSIKKVENHYSI